MQRKRKITIEEAREIERQLGVNQSVFDFEEFRRELQIELEHGLRAPEAKFAAPLTGKLALTHLKEFPDSHTRWTNSMPKRTWFRQRKG
jgi:hypothetical protein